MTRLVIGGEVRDYIARVKLGVHTYGGPFDKVDSHIIDYLKYLREKESSRIFYSAQGPQKHLRQYVMLFLLTTCQKEKYCWATVFSAVYMYDRFMDHHNVSKKQIHLVALACLIVSAKVEERDTNAPKIKQLKNYLPKESDYNPKLYIEIEYFVINYFGWKVNMVTPHTFLECFVLFAMEGTSNVFQTFPVLRRSLPINICQDVPFKIRDYAFLALTYILGAEPRDQHSPSVIAASCLQYARRRFGYNFWTQRLVDITGCSHLALVECLANYIDSEVPYDFSRGPLLEPIFIAK